jgi:hypothetical protein
MRSSDSRRSRSASATAAEPHHAQPQDAQTQNPEPRGAGPQAATSLDPRLWPRPYVDQPEGGPRSVPMRLPRFVPASPARPALPAAQADASPAGQPAGLPARRPPVPAGALPPGRSGAPGAPAAPPAGWAPGPASQVALGGARPQPVRAVIGDEIRIPFIWCEFGTCDATYTHPDALGERDLRNRALAAGWRYDALGRRACPDCAQHDPTFWPARPSAPVAADWRRAG